jgi:hypothetical protein
VLIAIDTGAKREVIVDNRLHTYPEIFNLGHRAVQDIFNEEVLIEEKVDGSQFSFGMIDGQIKVRSKGREFDVYACDDMFKKACETVLEIAPLLHEGCTYRGEYLSKPKHNALAYDRTPLKNIIIFDINAGEENYVSYSAKADEARRLGLEVVPRLFQGKIENVEQIRALLAKPSILGAQLIEGVVIKNYSRFTQQKKVMMGKYVSESFKEVHRQEWKKDNPTTGDIMLKLVEEYRTPARWNKAIQHLKENGTLLNDPKDIGPLMKEVSQDVLKECKEEIKDKLFEYAWKHLSRNLTRGLPEFYKQHLLESQFGTEPNMEKRIAEVKERSENESG